MAYKSISGCSSFILSACRSSNLLKKWNLYKKQKQAPLKLKTWLQHEKNMDLLKQPGILHFYVLPSCRNRSKMDNLLKLKLSQARKMLSWRMNSAFIKADCPSCMMQFNRAHLSRCNLNQELEWTHILDSKAFSQDLKTLTNLQNQEYNYTILDYLLNKQDYDLFLQEFSKLSKLLYKSNPPFPLT